MAVNRFAKSRKPKARIPSFLLPVAMFAVVLALFFAGVNSVAQTTDAEQLKATRQAVIRAAVQCYATEGSYPATLADLEQRYGLMLDHEKFVIDYNCFASNIMPDVTVIPQSALE